ncbi:hypothetical protein [Neobacillus sp. LXY-4]|uniref:hypothetical protein n=1 Tax=Neobacillus sp. LXY-4 TaxID=3379826 RepID=UPI003EE34220
MKKRNLILVSFGILLVVSVINFYINGTKQLYGNDEASIVKVINSIEGYENKSIEVLKIIDFDNLRIAAFLSNNSPGYIQFDKNKDGNYEWESFEVRDDETFSFFIPDERKYLFVTNNENKIAKMQVSINGQRFEQEFTPDKSTVTWVDLPKNDKREYTYRNYRFYDKDGNIIKEYE